MKKEMNNLVFYVEYIEDEKLFMGRCIKYPRIGSYSRSQEEALELIQRYIQRLESILAGGEK